MDTESTDSLSTQKQILDKAKYDILDRKSIDRAYLYEGILPAFGSEFLYVISNYQKISDFPLTIALSTIPVAYGVYKTIESGYNATQAEKQKVLIEDHELGLLAERIVYQGDENPLYFPTKTLPEIKKGDNGFYVHFSVPHFPPETPEEQVTRIRQDVIDYNAQAIKQQLEKYDYQFVIPEIQYLIPGFTARVGEARYTEEVGSVTDYQLMKGKEYIKSRWTDKQGGVSSYITSREVFEKLVESPREDFSKLVESLGDPIVTEFIDTVRNESDPEVVERGHLYLKRHLSRIIEAEVEKYFNTMPDVTLERTGPYAIPHKDRMYPRTLIREKEDIGLFMVQVNTREGSMRWVPLNDLLKTKGLDVEGVLNSGSPHKKSQIALVLYEMLKDTSIESLTEKPPTREELIARIKALGGTFHSRKSPTAERTKTRFFPKSFRKKISPLITSAVLFLASRTASQVADNWFSAEGASSRPPIEQKLASSEFPLSAPERELTWKIEGDLPIDGYYITGTSHDFSDKTWQLEDDRQRISTLPSALPENTLHLTLSRNVALNQFGPTRLRIPMRTDTQVSALSVAASDGKEIPFTVYRVEDGMVELEIKPALTDTPPAATIQAFLTPSETPTIHAVEEITPVKTEQLSEESQNILKEASSSDNPVSTIFTSVQNDHNYSLDPGRKELLTQAHTPEEVVNATAEIEGCSCSVCNTEAVLLASTLSENETVNAAFGYIAKNDHNAGRNDGYLGEERKHAFAIDEDGKILDATPLQLADDEMTKQYHEVLTQQGTATDEWENVQNKVLAEAEQQKALANQLKLGALGIAAAGSFFALRQARNILRKQLPPEKAQELTDNAFLSAFSSEELTNAYDFLTWLSWGGEEQSIATSRLEIDNKRELLNKIRDSVHYERVAQYIQSSKSLERVAGRRNPDLKSKIGIKTRLLAAYLLF